MSKLEDSFVPTFNYDGTPMVSLEDYQTLQSKLETSQVALKGAEERAKMLLDAKNHWADRARTAESRLGECQQRLADVLKFAEAGERVSSPTLGPRWMRSSNRHGS